MSSQSGVLLQNPRLPPASASHISDGDTQVTAPAAVVLKWRYWPAADLISARGSSSWHVANRTFMLRARTLTCDRTSGASGVSTATQPSGISSSPETVSTTRTVGSS